VVSVDVVKMMESVSPQNIEISVNPAHIFRSKTEINPIKKKSKGGYLEGSFDLPNLPNFDRDIKFIISSYPDDDLQRKYNEDGLVKINPDVSSFHPSPLFVCRKKGRQRIYEKEPVPNYKMHQQEFYVVNNVVKIVNKKSEDDEKRPEEVPEIDDLFPVKNNRIEFGDSESMLNIIVIRNHADSRSKNDSDLTVNKMIESRFEDKVLQKRLSSYFNFSNSDNKFKIRLRVDVFDLETNTLLGSGISNTIVNPDSKSVGALKIHDVNPCISCSNGGRKIIMISEFPLSDCKPYFQLWKNVKIKMNEHCWQRVDEKTENELLRQPEKIDKIQSSMIFISPEQPRLYEIREKNYFIKLVAVRLKDQVCSNSFDFDYIIHGSYRLAQPVGENFELFDCLFCDNIDSIGENSKGLVTKSETSKPNHKRKLLAEDQCNKIRKSCETRTLSPLSVSSDSGVDLSPHVANLSDGKSPQQSGIEELGFSHELRQDLLTLSNDVLEEWGLGSDDEEILPRGVATADGPYTVESDGGKISSKISHTRHAQDERVFSANYLQILKEEIFPIFFNWNILPLGVFIFLLLVNLCPDIFSHIFVAFFAIYVTAIVGNIGIAHCRNPN